MIVLVKDPTGFRLPTQTASHSATTPPVALPVKRYPS